LKEPVDSAVDTAIRAFKEANLWVVAIVLTVVLVPIVALLAILFLDLLRSPPGIAIMVILAVIAFISYKRKMRMANRLAESFVGEGPARTVELLWRPLEIEFRQVIESKGAVTGGKSVWLGTESFVRLESGNRFQAGMDEYVNQRQRVTAMSSSRNDGGLDQPDLEAERRRLVVLSEDLLDQARSAIDRYDNRGFTARSGNVRR